MKKKNSYTQRSETESEFHLKIPEGPMQRPQGGFFEITSGGGQHGYQQYAHHCLDEQGDWLSIGAFKTAFTTWSLEGANGVVLYPEGPAFKVAGTAFTEGDPPITYHTGPAHYTALIICLHPTFFPSTGSFTPEPNDQMASYKVTQTLEPDGPVDVPIVDQKPLESSGEIFKTKFNFYPLKVSYKITFFPSPTGRNTILLGGRLGTVPSESI